MSPAQSTILNQSGYQALSATSERGQPCDKNNSPCFQTHTVKTFASNNSVPLKSATGNNLNTNLPTDKVADILPSESSAARDQRYIEAVNAGNIQTLEALKKEGFNITKCIFYGPLDPFFCPLIKSVENNDLKTFQLLVKNLNQPLDPAHLEHIYLLTKRLVPDDKLDFLKALHSVNMITSDWVIQRSRLPFMHKAVEVNDYETFKWLLENEDKFPKNNHNPTVSIYLPTLINIFDLATECDSYRILRTLLVKRSTNDNKSMPTTNEWLHIKTKMSEDEIKEFIDRLKQCEESSSMPRAVLEYAIELKNYKLLSLLIKFCDEELLQVSNISAFASKYSPQSQEFLILMLCITQSRKFFKNVHYIIETLTREKILTHEDLDWILAKTASHLNPAFSPGKVLEDITDPGIYLLVNACVIQGGNITDMASRVQGSEAHKPAPQAGRTHRARLLTFLKFELFGVFRRWADRK